MLAGVNYRDRPVKVIVGNQNVAVLLDNMLFSCLECFGARTARGDMARARGMADIAKAAGLLGGL